jgi:gamma-glutamyltranspeptidase/glutathione hydrolase
MNLIADDNPRESKARRGMVVSVSPEASDVGVEMLKAGGNAVDAAVATALALAVTHPPAGNIGGGGFMLVLPPGGKAVCIDYRETAPAASTPDMFAQGADRHDHKMVGVPGTLRGLALAHERFGKLKWKQLVEPAVKLAAEGCVLDEPMAESLNEILAGSPKFEELQRVYGKPSGEPWQAGDRLVQKDLAATLQLVADDGPAAFYCGRIAEQLVTEMKAGGGLITLDDLKSYKAIAREPIHTTYRGYDVYGPPPPSSGGIALCQMLNILETFPLHEHGRKSPETLHLMIEAMKRAYCDRARHLGDADFGAMPEHLVTKDYARKLAAEIDTQKATPSEKLAGDIPLAGEGDSTTHFSVIDADGMAVSNTYTLEESYGSRIVVRGAGFLLNNEMGDFNWRPGHTDRLGSIGTPANVIAPGKRMLSSMTPTIVAKDGRAVLVVGSPGGRTIINTVLCMVLNVIDFEMDLKAAVDAPRLHHQWLPDVVRLEVVENQPNEETRKTLAERGHEIVLLSEPQGDVNAIRAIEDGFQGVADHRRFRGKAAGW